MLLAMTAVNLWIWRHHPYTASAGDWPLAAVLPPLLVGIALQAAALWRLAPDTAHPGPDGARAGHRPDAAR
jgi:hypothetical protein